MAPWELIGNVLWAPLTANSAWPSAVFEHALGHDRLGIFLGAALSD